MPNNLRWLPGGARGGDKSTLKSGDQLLMVVRLAGRLCGGRPYLDWHVIEVKVDGDGFLWFHSNGWNWDWSDVSYYLPLSEMDLPEDLK